MNTIIIDDLSKINSSGKMPNEFIFEKCKIIFGEYNVKLDSIIRIESDGEFENKYILSEIKYHKADECKVKIYLSEDNYFCGIEILESAHPKTEKAFERCGFPCIAIIDICNYIMGENRNRITRKKRNKNNNHKEEKEHTKQEQEKKVLLIDEIIEYVDEKEEKQNFKTGRKIECPCWGVRGHYRHYKSGKTIFVKEYRKGKNRQKTEPKNKVYIV